MAADQFCLRWNNFQSNIVSVLDNLKEEEDLVDVTLVCEGHAVKAHKVILSACSPYFRNVFKENPCQHPIVILKDVHNTELEALLNFMYQGEVYISQDRLSSFLRTAEILQVRGLTGASAPTQQSELGQTNTSASTSATPQTRTNSSQRNANRSIIRSNTSPPPLIPPSSIQQRDPSPPQTKRRKTTPRRVGALPTTLPKEPPCDDNQLIVTKQEPIDEDELGICREEDYKQDISAEEDLDDGEEGYMPQPASGSQSPMASDESTSMLARSLTAPRNSDVAGSNSPLQNLLLSGSVEGSLAVGDQQLSPEFARNDNRMSSRPCPVCQKIISNKSNLVKHMRIKHGGSYLQEASCHICGKVFKHKYSLSAHMYSLHRSTTSDNQADSEMMLDLQ